MIVFVLIFATWRLTSLLTSEEGPFGVFLKIREFMGIIHDTDGNVIGDNGSFFAGLLSCFWCTSIWVAAGLAILAATTWNEWVLFTFAASAGAIIIGEKVLG